MQGGRNHGGHPRACPATSPLYCGWVAAPDTLLSKWHSYPPLLGKTSDQKDIGITGSMILPDTRVWINHLRIWRHFDFLKLPSPRWLGVILWAGIYVSFWIQAFCCSCSFYITASIFIAAPLSGKQFHHNFWLLVFLPWVSTWETAPSQGAVFTWGLWIIILPASFAYLVPLCSTFLH